MADAVSIKLKGFKEMAATLRGLGRETRDKFAIKAASGAALVVKREAKAIALQKGVKDSGDLVKNIAIARQKPIGLTFSYKIGVRHGTKRQKAAGDDPYYWWWQEFGTKGGQKNGTGIKKRPFLTPAFWGSKDAQLEAMRTRLDKSISVELAKRSHKEWI